MSKTDRGPRLKKDLPTHKEVAQEVYEIRSRNRVEPLNVIVFGSYASYDYTS